MKHIKTYEIFESSGIKTWYHGTDKTFDDFEMRGTKGPSVFGIWFSETEDGAKVFGDNVKKVELEFSNPYKISQDKWDDIRMEHAKDSAYFQKWRDDLISKGHDALYVESRDVKFAGRDMHDPAMVAVFDVSQIKNAIKESAGFVKGHGLLLIKGKKLEDGKFWLYVVRVKDILKYAKRKDAVSSQFPADKSTDASMVMLGDEYFRIVEENGKLKAARTSDTHERMMDALALRNSYVALNPKKTPAHWMALKHTDPNALVRDLEEVIRNISGIKLYK